MVKKTAQGYQCEDCALEYVEQNWALRCEQWCKEHHSCNIEITSHATTFSKEVMKKT